MSKETVIELQAPPLPYYLGAGRSDFRIGEHHPHRRNLGVYDLLIVDKGELHMGENGRQWTLTDGEALLLLPDGEHYSVRPCERDTVFYWIHFEHASKRESTPAIKSDEPIYSFSRPFSNPYTIRIPQHARLSNPRAALGLIQKTA